MSNMVLNLKTVQNVQLIRWASHKNAFPFNSISLHTGLGFFLGFITNELLGKFKLSPPVKKSFEARVGSQIAIILLKRYLKCCTIPINSVAMTYSKRKLQNHKEVEV